jgi:hypothetical protein
VAKGRLNCGGKGAIWGIFFDFAANVHIGRKNI